MCRHNDRDDVPDAPLSKERDMPAILLCRLMKMPDVFARSCSDCPLLLRFDAPDKVKGERIDSCAERIALMGKGTFNRMRILNVHVEWRGRDPCHDAANFLLGRRSWGGDQFSDKAISGVFIGATGHSSAFFLRDARNGIGARLLLSSFTVDRFTLHAEHHTVNLVSIRQEYAHPSTLRTETPLSVVGWYRWTMEWERMQNDPIVDLGALETEKRNPATTDIDRMTALEIAHVMNAEDATVAGAVARVVPQIARGIEGIAARLRQGGRLFAMGAGTSGRLAVLDASECPPTFGTPPSLVVGWIAGGPDALTRSIEGAEDSADAGRADAARLGITGADVLVGVAASGRTPYVLGAVAYATEQGALTVGIACNAGTPLERAVAIMIAPVVGPEVISGSTRLKAGTAQKMALNMLSTGAMVLLGKTYGNLMVDVQPTNGKLRRRAVSIVREATGLPAPDAEALLHASGDEVKTAIVAALAGVAPQVARERLAAAGGIVRVALAGGR